MSKAKPLFLRIYPSYILLIIASLFLFRYFIDISVRDHHLERIENDLAQRAELLAGRINPLLFLPDVVEVDRICKTAGGKTDTRFTVVLPGGRVIGDTDRNPTDMENHGERPEVVKAFQGETGGYIRYSDTLDFPMSYAAVPVKEENVIIGVVRAAVSVKHMEEALAGLQRRILFTGLMILVAAAIVGLIVARNITRPIEAVRNGVERLSKGDLSYRLPTPKSKEMLLLVSTLNRLAGELENRIQDISSQRNELEAVLTSMRDGIIAFDEEEHILNINPAASRMLRRTPESAVGRTVQEVFRNPDLHQFIGLSLSEGPQPERDILFHTEGEIVLNTQAAMLEDADGNRIGLLVVFHDVTRLRRLERMRRDFVANVSHEIRTPLTAIKGFVETLRTDSVKTPEETDRFLGIIENHSNRLMAIINDLLRLSELEQSGFLPLKKTPVSRVMNNVAGLCGPSAVSRGIDLEISCPEVLSAEIHAAFLEQAVVNLVDNALKYSGDSRIVKAEAAAEGSDLVIRVSDKGAGISSHHLPRLFERFYRVDKSRSRKIGGTGLGLAIVKHIVQAHRGTVSVDSALGEGSCFTIRIPLKGFVTGAKKENSVGGDSTFPDGKNDKWASKNELNSLPDG